MRGRERREPLLRGGEPLLRGEGGLKGEGALVGGGEDLLGEMALLGGETDLLRVGEVLLGGGVALLGVGVRRLPWGWGRSRERPLGSSGCQSGAGKLWLYLGLSDRVSARGGDSWTRLGEIGALS